MSGLVTTLIATVLDTGPLAAAFISEDNRHSEAAAFPSTLKGRRLIPSPVLTEICWLLERRSDVESAFLEQVASGAFELVHLTSADLWRMSRLVAKYADLPLGGVDASVIAVAERLGVDRVATFDRRHFNIVRTENLQGLVLLP